MLGPGRLKFIASVIMLASLLIVIFISMNAVSASWESGVGLRVQSVEETIKTAAIYCYSVEGAYPESFHYLCENYGILVDESAFSYYYRFVGANIMPEIKVSAK